MHHTTRAMPSTPRRPSKRTLAGPFAFFVTVDLFLTVLAARVAGRAAVLIVRRVVVIRVAGVAALGPVAYALVALLVVFIILVFLLALGLGLALALAVAVAG